MLLQIEGLETTCLCYLHFMMFCGSGVYAHSLAESSVSGSHEAVTEGFDGGGGLC